MKFSIIILFATLTFSTNAQQISAEEKKIIDLIRTNVPQNLQLLEELVNINSGTLNIAGVKKVGDLLAKEFSRIGFTTEWISMPDSLKRAGHLVASIKGRKGKKLFLIGHLDTVFEPDMPEGPYKKVDDTTVTGQGVKDMKGGDIIILAALHVLCQTGALKDRNIVVYMTGDEERAGLPLSVSRGDFIERGRQSDIALAFEAAQGLNNVATARRGASSWQLKVLGRQAHSAGIFNNNYGAIYEASRIINQFREQLSTEKYLTFNPGLFAGGAEMDFDPAQAKATIIGKSNIISPTAVVTGDLRFLTQQQKENARTKMRGIVQTQNLPGTSASISFEDGIPSIEPSARHDSLVKVVSRVSMDLGFGPVVAGDPSSRGAGDIAYVGKFVDCVDGLGASGRGPAHAPGETINLNEFPRLI